MTGGPVMLKVGKGKGWKREMRGGRMERRRRGKNEKRGKEEEVKGGGRERRRKGG